MLTKKRNYINTKFPPKILQKALDDLKSMLGEDQVKDDHRIMVGRDERRYERGDEATFFKYYQSDFKWASYKSMFHSGYLQVYARWDRSPPVSEVYVRLPNESQVNRVLRIFDDAVNTAHPASILPKNQHLEYVDSDRINELREVTQKFDLAKLIRLCEELNKCYDSECFFSVVMLLRAILDHIPPIFSCKKFSEVANNYGGDGKSFKQSMEHLEKSSRKIADSHLHLPIRKKESLPNKTQVNFSNDLDVLLAEIARILK